MSTTEHLTFDKSSPQDAVLAGHVDSSKPEKEEDLKKGKRLLSLDFYRGLIMVLLMFEASGLYHHLINISDANSLLHTLATQFTHHSWHGLYFWDLIQPAFMFIAGTAMAFSITKQTARGRSFNLQAKHALKRSWWLFFWGVLIYAVREEGLSFELWNVLTQLSFTLLLAFLIFHWKPSYQILFSFGLLLLTEVLYRWTDIPGFSKPFTDQQNFGNYIDLVLMNKINQGGWVAINCIPTAAHTIWGAVAGKWLLQKTASAEKIRRIILFAIVIFVLGIFLELADITPIIKRISTSSFTLVTGGLCLLALAFLYYWIDVLNHRRYLKFFTIVGMNSIFIYLFFEIVVRYWLYNYTNSIVTGILSPAALPVEFILILSALVLFILQWYLCFWLYRKKIFFKV